MKALLLYGAYCTTDLWQPLLGSLSQFNLTMVTYPHALLKQANRVSDLAEWVSNNYRDQAYDFLIGHSMGGLIALELTAKAAFPCQKIIFIESNLKPAEAFYRNLMLPAAMQRYGASVTAMFQTEAPFYNDHLKRSLQEDFDYTELIRQTRQPIYGIYGDRGQANYPNRLEDLNLPEEIRQKINFRFIQNSCHLPMLENPEQLSSVLQEILLN